MWKPIYIGVGSRIAPRKQLGPWLRTSLDTAGPTYVKIGQFISNRPDIFGADVSNALAPLRNAVTPFPFDLVKDQVPVCVTDVDPVPIASASIAQIHRAKMKNKQIVLKFKRPGIDSVIREDLSLIRQGLDILKQISKNNFDFTAMWLNEFERGLTEELDFKKEVKNISLFRDIYRDRSDILVPRPYSKLSTSSLDYLPSEQYSGNAERLINMFLEQLLYEGVIHGDLHTGNIGQTNNKQIVLYDFGNVITVSPQYRVAMREFVYGVQTSNVETVMDNMIAMGMKVRDKDSTRIFIKQYFEYLQTLDLRSFSVNSPEMRAKAALVPVELDTTTLTILRTYSLIEGLCKTIDPKFSYSEIISKNIELLFLDLDYILYRLQKDIPQ
jgi:predicted unusual protein kinase regulating ubiquinone biosynthesis (AarF/ABC1/UbiB family)